MSTLEKWVKNINWQFNKKKKHKIFVLIRILNKILPYQNGKLKEN